MVLQSSCEIVQNLFESVKQANAKYNLLMYLQQIQKHSIKFSETTF